MTDNVSTQEQMNIAVGETIHPLNYYTRHNLVHLNEILQLQQRGSDESFRQV